MQEKILPILKEKEIFSQLSSNPLEEVEYIKLLEKQLLEKRGYVFKMPRPGTPVILLFSGGLDSTTVCDILLRKYKLKVYPLHLRRGQIRMPAEERSIRKLSTFFQKKFPKLYNPPQVINAFIPPLEFRFDVTAHAEEKTNNTNNQWLGIPMYTSIAAEYAVNYAIFLEKTKKIKVRTIFFGILSKDGLVLKYETLTFLRSVTNHICQLMGDFSWQVSSLPIEKQLGFYFDKEPLMEWCNKFDVPIQDSLSCLGPHYFHCGRCYYCLRRKNIYSSIGEKDRTFYLEDQRPRSLFYMIDKLFYLSLYIGFFFQINKSFLHHFIKYFFGRRNAS